MAMNSSDSEMGRRDSAGSHVTSNGISHFSTEHALTVNRNSQADHTRTAHKINHDPWYQLGFLLAVSFNGGYILGFSNFILIPLGWIWGIASLAVLAVLSLYANLLLANLHIIDGRRFIRYRDLMGFTLGRKMYYITCILQFLNFVLGNMGFLLLSGRALKRAHFANPFSHNYYADNNNDSGVMIGTVLMGRPSSISRFLCNSDCSGVEGALVNVCSRMQIVVCEKITVSEGTKLVI